MKVSAPENRASVAQKLNTWLMWVAGGVLLGTSLLKVLSALSHVPYLHLADPVLSFLSNRAVLFLAAQMEFAVAVLLLIRPQSAYARHSLLALCTVFVLYRGSLWSLKELPPCPCLGRASDWLHITPKQADNLAVGILLILMLIAAASLYLQRITAIPQSCRIEKGELQLS
jgi:hypothetical protein